MPTISSSFLFFFFFSALVLAATAQETSPHGLVYENPVAFSPSAYDFFHPKTQTNNPCTGSRSCTPLPIAAKVEANKAEESNVGTTEKGKSGLGGGSIASIVFGSAFVVVSAVGVCYVFVSWRSNVNRANLVQPNA